MSKFEHKDNSGSLFLNDEKLSDSHPNWKGSCKVAGVEYWVSEWEGETKGGKSIRNIKFTEIKRAHGDGIAQVKKEANPHKVIHSAADLAAENFEDDLPFS